ncbi:hypothetical protein [Catenuloplanes indicus]|uniref:TrbL/VirB6 plasmid conjugal transfer protein n=1 Tax=Catenuloplanes indicus TaxID=137267 RepID=A0AAE4AY69_9ACTN|nr:hypothetical protein [Catenuloplanes indicus]MDQ0366919.1 hypothetical protein [Catenuloplanes indicus]
MSGRIQAVLLDCVITAPTTCVEDAVEDVVGGAAASAWETVCRSFADAAVAMLEGFAKAFVAFPPVDLSSAGVQQVYGISLGIAALVAAMLLLFQIARTAITHDGSGLAQGLLGIGKAVVAFMATLTVAGTALVAADEITVFIIERGFGSTEGLRDKLTGVFEYSSASTSMTGALLLILALIGIVLTGVLWFELLLRNAAVAVLIATSPISAVGQMSDATRGWWPTLVSATIRLILLKPAIALVMMLGFSIAGATETNDGDDLVTVLAGLLILLLAVLAWPAIGRFFTFMTIHTGGPTGLASMLGAGANRAADAAGARAAGPAGVDPDQFGQAAAERTMSAVSSRTAAGAGAGATSAGGAAAGGPAAAGAGALTVAAAGLALAQKAANSLMGRMEQTAGHAGLGGVSPYPHPAGYSRGPIPTRTAPARPGGPSGPPPVPAGPAPTSPAPAPLPASAAGASASSTPADPQTPSGHVPSAPEPAPETGSASAQPAAVPEQTAPASSATATPAADTPLPPASVPAPSPSDTPASAIPAPSEPAPAADSPAAASPAPGSAPASAAPAAAPTAGTVLPESAPPEPPRIPAPRTPEADTPAPVAPPIRPVRPPTPAVDDQKGPL